MIPLNAKIVILGARGMVGSAILRELQRLNYLNILTPTRAELNLLEKESVNSYFTQHKPEYVYLAAAKVGGILANSTQQVEFGSENALIALHTLSTAHQMGVKKLLFLGSSCIYPKLCPQPIREEYLLTGPLEETNHMYALAKITGLKLCQAYRKQYNCDFISCMPTNLYGINDNFDLNSSHVLPAIIRKLHEAKVTKTPPIFWGDGSPRREFLFVEDMAAACVFLMNEYSATETINVGYGIDHTIKNVVEIAQEVIGYQGEVVWDTTKPTGPPQKLLNIDKITSLGWKPQTDLQSGIAHTYRWWINNRST